MAIETAYEEAPATASSPDSRKEGDRPVRRPLVRRVVLGAVFLVVVVGIVLGSGWGTLSSFGWESIATICPLGALESMLAAKLLIPRALVFLLLFAIAAILLGKVFCAWVCPVPSVRHALDALTKKQPFIRTVKNPATTAADAGRGPGTGQDSCSAVPDSLAAEGPFVADESCISPVAAPDQSPVTSIRVMRPLTKREQRALKKACAISSDAPAAEGCGVSACASCVSGCKGASRPALDSRHLVLGGSLLSAAIFGFPVFCLVCPIGLTFATVIVLAQLFGLQTLSWGLLLFPLLLVLELTVLRKWCGRFCPVGALMSLFARPNRTLRPHVDESKCLRSRGIDCQVCTGVCPEGLDPHNPSNPPSLSRPRGSSNMRGSTGAPSSPDLSSPSSGHSSSGTPVSSEGRHSFALFGSSGMHECSKCKDCAVNCPAGAITFPLKPR